MSCTCAECRYARERAEVDHRSHSDRRGRLQLELLDARTLVSHHERDLASLRSQLVTVTPDPAYRPAGITTISSAVSSSERDVLAASCLADAKHQEVSSFSECDCAVCGGRLVTCVLRK